MIITLKMLDIQHFFEKTGAGKVDDPSNKLLEILDMGSISFRKHEMKLWNKKLWNQENFETKRFWNQETKKPRKHDPPPLPRNMPTPTPAPDHSCTWTPVWNQETHENHDQEKP